MAFLLWKDLNAKPEARTASGRITILREPSPLILGALHLTMNRDFDMDEIFAHLVDEEGTNVSLASGPTNPPRPIHLFHIYMHIPTRKSKYYFLIRGITRHK